MVAYRSIEKVDHLSEFPISKNPTEKLGHYMRNGSFEK